jgi:Pentapeptide repeats (8 copies)/Ion channel
MPNSKHLAKLKEGVATWNTWRKENPEVRPNLNTATLREVNLNNANLRKADLGGANLYGASLQGANLQETSLYNAMLRKANLRGANLVEANLGEADLTGANLQGADLTGASMSNTYVSSVSLSSTTHCGITVGSTYKDSARFERMVKDQHYTDELRSGAFWDRLWYRFWWLSSDCGRSMGRWALWAAIWALLFGAVFTWLGTAHFHLDRLEGIASEDPGYRFLVMLYYSVVTFTTLGFGDVVPKTLLGALFVTLEVIAGYLMLGGLIALLGERIARRS